LLVYADFFEFEADLLILYVAFQCTCALSWTRRIKLKLAQWNHFIPQNVKPWLRSLAPLRAKLKHTENLSNSWFNNIGAQQIPVESHLAWMDATTIPTNLQEKAQEISERHPSTVMVLTPVQRRPDQTQPPSHENERLQHCRNSTCSKLFYLCNPND